jgi:hypothetical protein
VRFHPLLTSATSNSFCGEASLGVASLALLKSFLLTVNISQLVLDDLHPIMMRQNGSSYCYDIVKW